MINIELIEALQMQMNFCERERNYRCGIYVTTKEYQDIVMKVINNMLPQIGREVEIRNNQCESSVIYPNGNIIKIVRANSSVRGNRFNGVIIDLNISQECINENVLPYLRPLNLEDDTYNKYDNPRMREYHCCISIEDVIKSEKFRHLNCILLSDYLNKSQRDILDAMSYGIQFKNNDYINFKKECECMFYENDYDRPVVEKELNGDKVMLYEAGGIPKDLITYEIEFVNKTKQTYLNVYGKCEIPNLGFENDLNIHLLIDTKIYDGYEVHVEDGLATIILHEIKNVAPVLKDYGVTE